MLPDLRFVIGAALATALLAVVSVWLFTTVKLEPQIKTGPLQTSRNLGFHERADWNQFYHPEALRRFEELAGKSAVDTAAETGTAVPVPTGEAAPEKPATTPSSESPSESTAAIAPAPALATDDMPLWQDEPLFIVEEHD